MSGVFTDVIYVVQQNLKISYAHVRCLAAKSAVVAWLHALASPFALSSVVSGVDSMSEGLVGKLTE